VIKSPGVNNSLLHSLTILLEMTKRLVNHYVRSLERGTCYWLETRLTEGEGEGRNERSGREITDKEVACRICWKLVYTKVAYLLNVGTGVQRTPASDPIKYSTRSSRTHFQ